MRRLLLARSCTRVSLLAALAALAVLGAGGQAALAAHRSKPKAKPSAPAYYTLTNAKQRCRAHYTKQTVTLRVRKHGRFTHVHQVRCVYTGNGASLGGVPSFPTGIPTAAISVAVIPTAVADSYTVGADQTLTVGGSGVLANDLGSGLSAALVSGPAHGTLTLRGAGSFSYVPAAGFSGIDHFSYRDDASSGESSTPATVTIDVTPVAEEVGVYTVGSGDTLAIAAPGLLDGDIGNALRAVLVAPPADGTLTLNANGSFTYAADAGFAGVDSFQFAAVDSSGLSSNTVTVEISVGAGPPNVVAETFDAVGNTELQVGGTAPTGGTPVVYQAGAGALANDSDPYSNQPLTTTQATVTTQDGGTVDMHSDGTFTYEPPTGTTAATDSFNYQVDSAEGASQTAIATIDFKARVWYVNAAAASGGDGSASAPFQTIADATAHATSGDTIFVYSGNYGGGVTLAAGEALFGQPAGLDVGGLSVVAAGTGTNPVITNNAGAGIAMSGGDTVDGVDVQNTSGAGISVSGANSFTIGSNVAISGAAGDALDVNGGDSNATVGASITSSTTGHSVDIENRSGGVLTLSGSVTDTGEGVLLADNPGAQIDFTGLIESTPTSTHSAFEATGGGTVSSTDGFSVLSSTDAAALDVSGDTIAGGTLPFVSVTVDGSGSSADGILLANTAPGGVTVSGDNAVSGSGGTIQGTTGAAVSATDTGSVSLSYMDFTGDAGDDVSASAVSALTVDSSSLSGGLDGVFATGATAGDSESNPQTFTIESDIFGGQQDAAIALTYTNDSSGYLESNFIGAETPSVIDGSVTGDGIDIKPTGGTMQAEVTGNQIYEIQQGTGIATQTPAGGELDLTLSGNQVTMDSSSSLNGITMVGSSGTTCLNPASNDVTAAGTGADGIELDQPTTNPGLFEITGYTTGNSVASFLEGEGTLIGGSGGQQAVALPGDSSFTGQVGACATPGDHTT